MKFSELDKRTQIAMSTIPHCVYVTVNPDDETEEQVMERQEKFLKLPEKIQDKLLSREVSKKIQQIGKRYGLSLIQMGAIARLIRSYYFNEAKEADFANILMRETKIDSQQAQEIARYVTDNIIKSDGLVTTSAKVKLTLKKALEQYPKTKEQILAEKMIKVLGKPYPVKATVENWLKDYRSVVGVDNNDVMKRSAYLYSGENARGLTENERQRLAELLKSWDEDSLLVVDKVAEKIVFTVDEKGMHGNNVTNFKKSNRVTYQSRKKEILRKSDVHTDNLRKVEQANFEINENQLSSGGTASNSTQQRPKIKPIQGNNWSLNSHHFEDKNKKVVTNAVGEKKAQEKSGLVGRLFGVKRKEQDVDGKIRFSSSQQLPVEKNVSKKLVDTDKDGNVGDGKQAQLSPKSVKRDEGLLLSKKHQEEAEKRKKERENNYFGKIKPIDY